LSYRQVPNKRQGWVQYVSSYGLGYIGRIGHSEEKEKTFLDKE